MGHKWDKGERVSRHGPYGMTLGADGIHLKTNTDEQAVIVITRKLCEAGLSTRAMTTQLAEQGLYSRAGTVFTPSAILAMVREEGEDGDRSTTDVEAPIGS